jgi:hypothetical protein
LAFYFYFFKLTVSTVQLLYTVREKGGKPDGMTYPLYYGLRNPYRKLKSENSQDYAQKPQQNCMFMNSASEHNKGRIAAFAVRSLLFNRVSQILAIFYNWSVEGLVMESKKK